MPGEAGAEGLAGALVRAIPRLGNPPCDITGLIPGDYDVTVYAPRNAIVSSGDLSVNGVSLPRLTGDPSGSLLGGTSFLTVRTTAVSGAIDISGSGSGFKGLAGIQLVPSPEPSGPVVSAVGATVLSALARRRRRAGGARVGRSAQRDFPAAEPPGR